MNPFVTEPAVTLPAKGSISGAAADADAGPEITSILTARGSQTPATPERDPMTTPSPAATAAETLAAPPVAPNQRRRSALLDPRTWNQVRFILDLLILYLAVAAATLLDSTHITTGDLVLGLVFPLICIVVLRASPIGERLRVSVLESSEQVIACTSLSAMLIVACASIFNVEHPLGLSVRLWLYSSVYLGISRGVLISIRRRVLRGDAYSVPTLIIGAGVIGSHLTRRLVSDRSYGLRPVGLIDPDPLPGTEQADISVPILGGLDDLASAVRTTGARHVILAFSSEPDHLLAGKVRECQALGIEVSLVPRLYETVNERTTLDHVGGLPLLTLHQVNPYGWQFAIKHTMDWSVALLAIICASPLLIAITALVKLSSPGPIFFRQRRVGRDGKEFDVLKFRTMREPSSAEQATSFILPSGAGPGGVEGVDRRTPVGRILRDLSLDELPQLFNVVRGDMSLVGPRPERPEYVARFAREVVGYENRHRVRSGITGWAQVHGLRGQTSIADRVEWDNYYILNWSLRLDFRILAMTVAEVLRFRESN
jgi:exopolysaccharide biosynthesis polyprenyl glycosylphosphotransferase